MKAAFTLIMEVAQDDGQPDALLDASIGMMTAAECEDLVRLLIEKEQSIAARRADLEMKNLLLFPHMVDETTVEQAVPKIVCSRRRWA